MNIPKRWQRSRQAGAKQPGSCRYVGRRTKYGNPHKVATTFWDAYLDKWFDVSIRQAHEIAVEEYFETMSEWLRDDPAYFDDLLNYEYISCFCPLDMPCHCDAIIEHLKARIEVQS